MTHREILEALSGLLLVLFVAMLSSTVVSNALPKTIEELKGTQTEYIWVITATLLTATASTPIWGKLADLFSKKVLIQTAIVVFLAGSVVCGLAQSPGQLIAARAFQGLGTGGPLLGGIVFLSQYLQVARGYTPTKAGLITIPLMGGVLTASVIIGQLVSRTGRIKPFIIFSTITMVAGFAWLSTIDHATSGDATGHIFLVSTGVAVFAIIAAVFLPPATLRSSLDLHDRPAAVPQQGGADLQALLAPLIAAMTADQQAVAKSSAVPAAGSEKEPQLRARSTGSASPCTGS